MGAWSTTILGNDFAADVYGEFIEAYNDGKELNVIRRELEANNQSELNEPDEGSTFWLALAKAQWDCDSLDSDVVAKVGEIVNTELGLDRWREATARDLEKRRKVLAEFYAKIQKPHPKPKKRKKTCYIPAVFEAGDCLVLHLPSGNFGAALVLAANNTSKPMGTNLIAVLQFRSIEKPAIEVFELRKWLVLTHHAWKNQLEIMWYFSKFFKRHTHPIEKIGSIKLQSSDPKNSEFHTGNWNGLAESVDLQFDWDAGKRD